MQRTNKTKQKMQNQLQNIGFQIVFLADNITFISNGELTKKFIHL